MPQENGLPHVTLHYAQTIDGRIATRNGESQWISGDGTLAFAHQLRATHDAVLVGIGTIVKDNPKLTVRLVEARDPTRVIVDSTLRIPLSANVLQNGAAHGTILAVTERSAPDRIAEVRKLGAQVLVVQAGADGNVDLTHLLHRLWIMGIKSLLVEGGSRIITSFLQQHLVDRLTVCIAPKVLGCGTDAVGDLGIVHLADALGLSNVKVEQVGEDVLVDATVNTKASLEPLRHSSVAAAQAVWFTGPKKVQVREEDLSNVGPDDVRVKTDFSAISHGTEMLVYKGQVAPDLALDLATLSGSFAFPIKYGYASSGTIVGKGESVKDLSIGDKVFVLHPHQTEYNVPARSVMKLPSSLPTEAGVFAANVETALNVLLDAPVRLSENVAIFGQGVVGLLLTQIARRSGAGRIVVVDPIPRRRELALQLGADVALTPEKASLGRLKSLTDGRGIDIAYEVSGTPAGLQQAIDAVSPNGLIVAVSWYGTKPVTLDLGGSFHRGRLRIASSQVGTIEPSLSPRWDHARRSQVVCDLLSSLTLTKLITHHFPLRSVAEAYRLIDEHPEETVQVVLTY